MARVLFEFLFKQLHQRKAVSSGTRETANYIIMDLAQFLGCVLEHGGTEGDLSVRNKGDLFAFAHTEHGSAVEVMLSVRKLVSSTEPNRSWVH